MEGSISDNQDQHRYEMQIDDQLLILEYIKTKEVIYLTHTEVSKKLEGQGYGSEFVKAVLKDVEQNNWKLMPLCPFVAAYIKRHPEWQTLLQDGVRLK